MSVIWRGLEPVPPRLSMPSDYNESTPRVYHNYTQSDSASLSHRAILKAAMEQVGFSIFPWKWWHYDFRGWESCFTYDLSHRTIREANKTFHKAKAK